MMLEWKSILLDLDINLSVPYQRYGYSNSLIHHAFA